jgi:hypothetical protein
MLTAAMETALRMLATVLTTAFRVRPPKFTGRSGGFRPCRADDMTDQHDLLGLDLADYIDREFGDIGPRIAFGGPNRPTSGAH